MSPWQGSRRGVSFIIRAVSHRIGFIGLGVMGAPMAGHLAKAGHPLTLLDIDRAKATRLADAHARVRVAGTPRDVAASSDIVITMLPSGKYVQDVAIGDAGLIEGFRGGELLIDTSSCEPWLTIETAKALAARNVAMVDAATSGAEMGAKAATLVFMAGGDSAAVERARDVLAILGKHVFHLGPIGAGHTMKSINNTITAMTLVATAEGLALGKKLGLDPNVMTDVLNVSTGMSWITQTHIKQRITSRAFDDPFKLELMVKDIRIALELAQRAGTRVPLWAHGQELWRAADRQAQPGASVSELVRYVERESGVEIAPP
jgi:3-hydroxyisobutyrate dehydrogenase